MSILPKVKKLLLLMHEYGLTEIQVEEEGQKILLKKDMSPSTATPTSMPPSNHAIEAPEPDSARPDAAEEILSPMVGTFYVAPEPGAAPFVEVGDRVHPDTVVCILEAMKVMNEIKAEKTGSVISVLVENGQPVEYGQPLFSIDTSS